MLRPLSALFEYTRYGGYLARAKAAFTQGKIAAANAIGSNVRFAAYGSDFGEGLRPVLSESWIRAAYGVSIAYIIGDVAYHTWHVMQKNVPDWVVWRTAIHATVFQIVASLALPYVIIHTAVKKSSIKFNEMKRFTKIGPSAVGLGLIPFLPLVDEPVELLIDVSIAFHTSTSELGYTT